MNSSAISEDSFGDFSTHSANVEASLLRKRFQAKKTSIDNLLTKKQIYMMTKQLFNRQKECLNKLNPLLKKLKTIKKSTIYSY